MSHAGIQELNKAKAQAQEACRVLEQLNFPQWADKHFYLAEESSSISGDWKTLPWQYGIMLLFYWDDVRVVDFVKSAQVGGTKIITADILYNSTYRKRNNLIYQPTDSEAKAYTEEELDPVVKYCSVVRSALAVDPNKKSKYNTSYRKKFAGSLLDIRGGKSERNYRRLTKDRVYVDDADGFDRDIEGAGSPLTLSWDRVSTSSFPKQIVCSTPRDAESSIVTESSEHADMSFNRHLPCPHCDEYHALDWVNAEQDGAGLRTGNMVCPDCGAVYTYREFAGMDKRGKWVSDCGHWIDEKEERIKNEFNQVVPFPDHAAVHIWAGYSYFVTWSDLAREFNEAKVQLKRGNIRPLKTFINTKLGQAWKEQGEAPEISKIHEMRLSIDPGIVGEQYKVLTMGVDVQGDRVYYEIRAWGAGMDSQQIDHGELFGPTQFRDSEVWKQLGAVVDGIYSGYPVQLCLVDSGYNKDAVYDFCRLRPGRTIPCKGQEMQAKPVYQTKQDVSFDGRVIPQGMPLWNIHTNYFKDFIHARLNIPVESVGSWKLNRATTDDYCNSLTAEHKIEVKPGVYRWKAQSKNNHYLDCGVYGTAAAHILGAYTLQSGKPVQSHIKKKPQKRDLRKYWS